MSWIKRLFKTPEPDPEPFDFANNPYKAKKRWPPDFSQLSAKEQFRFEKKFRRRNKLAWKRPRWTKATKIVQWSIIGSFTFYSLFYYVPKETEEGEEPLPGLRRWWRNAADGIWSAGSPSMTKENALRLRRPSQPATEDKSTTL